MSQQKPSKKHGRNKKSGQNLIYRNELRHEKSHVRRIRKHIARYGSADVAAVESLLRLSEPLGLHAVRSAKEFIGKAA